MNHKKKNSLYVKKNFENGGKKIKKSVGNGFIRSAFSRSAELRSACSAELRSAFWGGQKCIMPFPSFFHIRCPLPKGHYFLNCQKKHFPSQTLSMLLPPRVSKYQFQRQARHGLG